MLHSAKRLLKPVLLTFFAINLLFLLLLQQSCKKTDNAFKDPMQAYKTARFFKLPANASSPVKRVAEALQKQNDTKEFINSFVKNEGFAIWNKACISVTSRNNNSPVAFTTNTTSGIDGGSDTTVIIPLVLDSARNVNAFILAKVYADSTTMQFYRNSDYQYFPFQTTTPTTVTTAEDFAIYMMQMDKAVFGDTRFAIKDKRLFNNSDNYKDTAGISRIIDLGNNNGGYTINYAQMICVAITTTTTSNHCPYPPNQCPDIHTGVLGPCDNCQEYCASTSTRTSTQCLSTGGNNGWPSFPPPPPPTGGGGSGGGTPCPPQFPVIMTNSAIPINCNPIPNPWPPAPYSLSPNDIRVINQLNAEDAEVDSSYANMDCNGTKRTGNINFSGTLQHWLIQLDYIAKHPIDGDREYAIPGSGPTGGRGYADVVNTGTNEIFEIKPTNLKADGIAEVGRYVTKANENCPTLPMGLWHQGTNYTQTRLPWIDPTKNLVASLSASGVITYDYEPKANNPLPIVVPSSVIDKLKELVDKLKSRLSDADAILSEYMAGHPELVTYIKSAAFGAAVAIVVGTIVEDIVTAGAGILDDWASFVLAYRIVRFAWAL